MKTFTTTFAVSSLLAAASVGAATLTLTPVVSQSYQADFTPVQTNPDVSTPAGVPLVYQVDFYMQIADLAPDQGGFGNMAFTVDLLGLTQNGLAPGWQPNTSLTFDANGPAPGGITNIFADNGDFGTVGDLVHIVVGIDAGVSNPADPRYTIGQSDPVLVGSIFVDWDGVSAATLVLTGNQFLVNSTGGLLTVDPNPTFLTSDISFVPEPATLSLLGLGGMALLLRRRTA